MQKIYMAFVDRLGVWASVGCLIHCIALPLLVSLSGLAGLKIFLTPEVETTMIVITLCIAFCSLSAGCFLIHKKISLFSLPLLASIVFVFKAYMQGTHETVFVLLAAGLLITAHTINGVLCRHCQSCTDKSHKH